MISCSLPRNSQRVNVNQGNQGKSRPSRKANHGVQITSDPILIDRGCLTRCLRGCYFGCLIGVYVRMLLRFKSHTRECTARTPCVLQCSIAFLVTRAPKPSARFVHHCLLKLNMSPSLFGLFGFVYQNEVWTPPSLERS